ncbi:MAG: LytR C-terminal domain-containing protein [Candidatus Daviesbacteria bacterium]|nr:LytR C-terminal domain-containing protein [Candidatus Daviesbacteria bacterium]
MRKKGWKDVQSRIKQNRRTKLAIFVLALVAGMLILSWVIQFTQRLFSPLGAVNQQRNYVWNGEFNINLLVRTSHIALFSYNPKEEKITIIKAPDELFLDVPFGFGLWQLRAVYELGQTQKGMGGDRLLKDTLTSFFAVPIDGFLDFSSLQPSKSASEIVEILKKNPFSGLNLLSSLKTDLTIWELLRLKVSLSRVRFDKVKELDLVDLGVLERENLPDGTGVLITDPIKLDSVLSDFVDPAIVSEHKTIAVFNATDKVQLAGKWARLITNLGGNVIIMNNARERLKKTTAQGEESLTLKRIRQVFCDTIGSSEDVTSSRAQINLFIGEDYLNK